MDIFAGGGVHGAGESSASPKISQAASLSSCRAPTTAVRDALPGQPPPTVRHPPRLPLPGPMLVWVRVLVLPFLFGLG